MEKIYLMLKNLDPMVISISFGIAFYLIFVAMIPSDFLFKTKYTKKHLKTLHNSKFDDESEDNLVMNNYKSKGILARAFYTLPFYNILHPYIVKAGMEGKVGRLFFYCIIVFEGGLFILSSIKSQIYFPLIVVISFVFSCVVGWIIVKQSISMRSTKFVQQLPDSLDIIVRSVISGFPVNAAINMVYESMDAPIRDEFKQVSDEILYGSTLVDALNRLSERMQLPDVRFFAVVLTLQQEVGGNLSEALSNLSQLIRKRRMIKMKMNALTSEGRTTGWLLGALPIFVGVLINFLAPDFMAPLFETTIGNYILIAAVSSVAIGVGIVRKMSSMRI